MTRLPPRGILCAGRRKLAVAFEIEVFARLLDECNERGASFSDHLNWLVKDYWRLKRQIAQHEESEARRRIHAQEVERRRVVNSVTREKERPVGRTAPRF